MTKLVFQFGMLPYPFARDVVLTDAPQVVHSPVTPAPASAKHASMSALNSVLVVLAGIGVTAAASASRKKRV